MQTTILNEIKQLNLTAIELKKQGDLVGAINCLERALQIESHEITLFNLGVLYFAAAEFQKAHNCFEKIKSRERKNHAYYYFYGQTLVKLKLHFPAIEQLENAIKLNSEFIPAQLELLDCYLFIGEFSKAKTLLKNLNKKENLDIFDREKIQRNYFQELLREKSWQTALSAQEEFYKTQFFIVDNFKIPRWSGQTSTQNTIFIVSNEGVGDDLMYSLYLPELQQRFKHVIFECDKRLIPLLNYNYPTVQFVDKANLIERKTALRKTDYVNFSYNLPAIIPPTSSLQQHSPLKINEKIIPCSKTIGISYFSTAHNAAKRMPNVEFWQTLFDAHPQMHFINLQDNQHIPTEKQGFLANHPRLKKIETFDLYNNFIELSKLVLQCEHIITIDNTLAHLCGRLNVSFTLILGKSYDWRWFDAKNPSWYPSATFALQKTL